jgi:hypothetical protein
LQTQFTDNYATTCTGIILDNTTPMFAVTHVTYIGIRIL